jgi:hypothetical protein
MARSVQLWVFIYGAWCSILTIPIGDFQLFTTCPLRWLMYLGSTIYGCQGRLKADPEGLELVDYTITVGNLNNHYYFYSQGNSTLLVRTRH